MVLYSIAQRSSALFCWVNGEEKEEKGWEEKFHYIEQRRRIHYV